MELTVEQKDKLKEWLNENFQPFRSVNPAGSLYLAYPVFSGAGKKRLLEHDAMADTCEVGDLKIRIRQFSPTMNSLDPNTGSYCVAYEIVEPDENYQKLVELTKKIAEMPNAGNVVLRALMEVLGPDELAFIGENLFDIERKPL